MKQDDGYVPLLGRFDQSAGSLTLRTIGILKF
jgi:hypothetical protein